MPGIVKSEGPLEHFGRKRIRLSGRFFPNGNSAIVLASNQGRKGWTVAYTSTGLYTLTLYCRPMKLLLLGLGLQLNAAAARSLQWGAVTFNADGTTTVQIRNVDAAGAVQDIAANANNSISFDLEAVQDSVGG